MLEKIQEAKSFIQQLSDVKPKVGIVLGSGLGKIANEISIDKIIPYDKIPHFPISTIEGHQGQLIIGKMNQTPVVVMQGRSHYYEGHTSKDCTFPIRVLHSLGIEYLILTNASGGVNPHFNIGDIMLITDHINLMPDNPLRGKNIAELGPRFPDMSEPYNQKINVQIQEIAQRNNIILQEGVYASLPGPNYETPAEYRFIQKIGADAVGMSTVPEVIVANHMNIPCVGLSVITDLGIDGKIVEISHEEVQEVAQKSEPKITLIIKELIRQATSD